MLGGTSVRVGEEEEYKMEAQETYLLRSSWDFEVSL